MLAKVAIIESTESTENWRTAYWYAIGADRRKTNSVHTHAAVDALLVTY